MPTKAPGDLSRSEKRELLRKLLAEASARARTAPASFAQERLWLLHRLDPASTAYNVPVAVRLAGALDERALERALGEVVRRHETLRTTFAEADGAAVQVIAPFTGFPLAVEDLSAVPAEEREAVARRRAEEEGGRAFDLARGPLFHARLLRLAADDHVLLLCMHHVISDGWSLGVLFRELWTLYGAFREGRESPLAEPTAQYADYAVWQRGQLQGDALEKQLAYWRERLAGAPPVLDLPTDHPRPAAPSHRGAREGIDLPPELLERLQALARQEGATLYMVLLGAFQLLLAKYTGNHDVVVGSAVAGRTRSELEQMVGCFVNSLVMRTDLSGRPTFRELVQRVRAVTLGAFRHQDVPFETLVEALRPERTPGHSPLFQVMFLLQNMDTGDGDGAGVPGLRVQGREVEQGIAKFDLSLGFGTDARGLHGVLEYSTDLFERPTIVRMLGHLRRVLEQMAADPDARTSDVQLAGPEERAVVVEAWNRTAAAYPADRCIHQLFEAQATRTPDAVAVAFGGETITYRELDARANRIANHLARLGVGPEVRVGLCLERGMEIMPAILGVMKAGGAYVPVDPSHPAERIAYVLEDSGVSIVLTQERLRDRVAVGDGVRVLAVDAKWRAIATESPVAPRTAVASENLAYVIYTSGSTGRPKGVAMHHRGVCNYIDWGIRFYGADAGNGAPVFSSLAVDLTITNLLPLFAGRPVRFLAEENAVEALADVLREKPGFGLIKITPVHLSLLTPMLSADEARAAAGTLVIGADLLPAEPTVFWQENAPGVRLMNEYGPTETVVGCSAYLLPNGVHRNGAVPVGGPIQNLTFYVLDAAGHPVPVGVPGELFIGGAGVARGYLGRPALTAEKFVPDTFAADGARMYRTGDRAKWLDGGNLMVLGRTDSQVKVRGYRVELGEIEAVLRRHEAVTGALVVLRQDEPGDPRLVAYVVGDAEAEALREHVRRALPEYMVPSAFVRLESLPKTATGKIDPKTLPAPGYASEARYVAPRTPVEEVLAGLWAEVLGVERVGTRDSFFELGGHSLLATRIVSRIRALFGVEVSLRHLFEAPTVAALAARVDDQRRADSPPPAPLVRVERIAPPPLSFAQERLWFLDRLQPGGTFYNVPLALRLDGPLDVPALERALGEIVRRHDALRTTLVEAAGAPVQVVAPFAGFTLPVDDLSALEPAARRAEMHRRAAEDAARPFDLATGPLFRAQLLRLADEQHALLIAQHHVVTDGWSTDVFFRELGALYGAFREGKPSPLPELALQYADHAVWQRGHLRGERLDRELAWWRGQLAGAPELLELPTDHVRPAMMSFRGAYEPVHIPAELLARLQALGRGQGATLFMVVLGAFQLLLSRWGGSEDVVVGTTIAGRSRSETEALIGLFMNTLVLRTDLSGDPEFGEVLRRVREVTLGAYEHQDVPFERLVTEIRPERSLGHTPLFQVLFELLDRGGEGDGLPGGITLRGIGVNTGASKFDLSLGLAVTPDGLEGRLTYATDLFEPATAKRMVRHLERVLEQVAAGPSVRLSEVELMGDDERRVVLEEWNRTAAAYPADRCIHQLFEAQAEKTPDATAVVYQNRTLTFRELNERANRLAHHLRRRGVGPEVRVGICLERSLETMISILGVMKAGAAWVPLDAAYPVDRLRFMMEDSAVAALLTQERLREKLPVPDGVEVVRMDGAWASLAAADAANLADTGVTPENLAYVIYTSGSTGRPKGVAMHHRGVCNYIAWGMEAYGAARGNGSPVFSSIAVDLTVTNLLPLFAGLPVRILPEEAPVEALADALRRQPQFGLIKITPVHLSLLTPLLTPEEARGAAHTLVVGADFLTAEPTLFWQDNAPGVRLMNEYGPTETVVGCSAYTLPNGKHRAGPVPVGRPIQNLAFYVLDRRGRPVAVGLPGELYIGGAGVARGYLGRPGLTAQKFVPDPFAGGGARMYRTGDRARWTPEGELMILGRTDNQVKVRGFRVEPGEIEAVLRRHEAVRDCLVVVREDAPGDRRLVAYVVGDAEPEALKAHLLATLPEYMVPSAFVRLESLPQTVTGKLDPRALPAPDFTRGAEVLAPRTELERTVAEVWRRILAVPEVGATDNFFDLGGTSLLLYRVYSELREIRPDLRVVDLFRLPTVEALARHLAGDGAKQGEALGKSRSRAEARRAALAGE